MPQLKQDVQDKHVRSFNDGCHRAEYCNIFTLFGMRMLVAIKTCLKSVIWLCKELPEYPPQWPRTTMVPIPGLLEWQQWFPPWMWSSVWTAPVHTEDHIHGRNHCCCRRSPGTSQPNTRHPEAAVISAPSETLGTAIPEMNRRSLIERFSETLSFWIRRVSSTVTHVLEAL